MVRYQQLYGMNLHIHAMQLLVMLLRIHFARLASAVTLHASRNSLVSMDEETASQRGQMSLLQSHKVRHRLQEHLLHSSPGSNNQMVVPWDEENRHFLR